MSAKTKVTTTVGNITTSGGYFSGVQLAKNIRSFINGIKKS